MTTLVGGGNSLISKSFTAADSGTTLTSGPLTISDPINGISITAFGNYQNISFNVSDSVNNTSLVLSNVNVDLAGNTFILGNGTNTVFGNIQDLSFSVSNTSVDSIGSLDFLADPTGPGIPDQFGIPTWTTTYDVGINNVNVIMGGNTINIAGGTSVIYGTMRDLNMSDLGGNAVTSFAEGSTGSQVTVNTMIANGIIDLTDGGVGNKITVGNGSATIYGDLRSFSMTGGGASANSDPNDPTFSFPASPNIQAITSIENLTFDAGGNQIKVGNGTATVYGDMQTLNMTATPDYAYGYNSIAAGGVGDQLGTYINTSSVTNPSQGANGTPPYAVQPTFDTLNLLANNIQVGNGNNVIYGDLQTLNLTFNAGSAASPGSFFNSPGSNYDDSSLPVSTGFGPGTVSGAAAQVSVAYVYMVMGSTIGGVFTGNTITAGVGNNTIYGDLQNFVMPQNGGTTTGVFPPFSTGLNSLIFTPVDYAGPFDNVTTMAGNLISAGLMGSGTNTVYGSMQDMILPNVAGVGNAGYGEDAADFVNMLVLGGTGVFNTVDPSLSIYPLFIPTLTGNTVTVGKGTNLIYGDMRDFITTDAGGVDNGHNLANQAGAIGAQAYTTINNDRSEYFMGDNHINAGLSGSSVNTIYGAMRDLINVNGGVDNNGTITSDPSTIENVASNGNEASLLAIDVLISIAGNTINVGSGTNTIYGDMRDIIWDNFGGIGLNITVDSFAAAAAYDTTNFIFMGDNTITAQSGVNTIDGDFRNLEWDVSGGVNSTTPSGNIFGNNAGSNIRLTTIDMGNNTITAGTAGVASVNHISGDGENIDFVVTGGNASLGLAAWDSITKNQLTMGDNTITIKGGGTSTIYGDVQNISWTVHGGHANGANTGGSYADAQVYGNTLAMGGNHIVDTGNGTDTIYGDAQTLSLAVAGGTVLHPGSLTYLNLFNGETVTYQTDASGYIINNIFTFAGNTIHGGSGNDTIYASLENLSFSAQSGSLPGEGGYFSGSIVYPDGGSNFRFEADSTIHDTGNHITFGNETVVGGAGSDTIIGSDVLNLTGLNAFLTPSGSSAAVTWFNNSVTGGVSNNLVGTDLNQINFGNELLTGGSTKDTFEFTLLSNGAHAVANQGNATITDFGGKDQLEINTSLLNGHTVAYLDSVAVFSHPAANETLITFGAGSILLEGSPLDNSFNSFANMYNTGHLIVH